MTLRSSYKIEFQCGHKGEIIRKENDQPFAKNWEKYSLIGFEGESFSTEGSYTLVITNLPLPRVALPDESTPITADDLPF
jgi:hypothetical protein